MANVQPENGTTSIANEIIRQVFMTGLLSKTQLQIVFAIIDESWAWVDRRHPKEKSSKFKTTRKPIKPKEFASKTRLHISDVCKTLNFLIEAKVVRRHWDYYRFNKDYDNWNMAALVIKKTRENAKSVREIPQQIRGFTNGNHDETLGDSPNELGKKPNNDDDGREITYHVRGNTYERKKGEDGIFMNSMESELGKTPNDTRENPYSEWGKSLMRWPAILRAARIPESLNKLKESINKVWVLYNGNIDYLNKTSNMRYEPDELLEIIEYWNTIKFTRKSGKIAESIIETEMEYWERFDKDVVLASLKLHISKYQSTKKEEYTRGIMRRAQDERKRGLIPDVLRQANESGIRESGRYNQGSSVPRNVPPGQGRRRVSEEQFDDLGIGH